MKCDNIHDVLLKDIRLSNLNVRRTNVEKDLDELAASIKRRGLLQPVILLGTYGSPPYKLIAGQRRFLAHQKLKRPSIAAVFAGDLDDTDATLLSLVENLQAVDLNHADSAKAITSLYEAYDKDEQKVQKETGLSLRRIRDYLTIESQASPKMKQKLRKGDVTPSDVKRALRAAQGNITKAERLLDLMSTCELTKHQKKRIIEYGEAHQAASADKILEEARRPRVEQSIVVSLPDDLRKGLEKATRQLELEADDILMEIIHDWLSKQGFIGA
jgi:ParB/RepB/Spo0J family partition protein